MLEMERVNSKEAFILAAQKLLLVYRSVKQYCLEV